MDKSELMFVSLGGISVTEVKCEDLLVGKTIKCGEYIIIGTKTVGADKKEQAS
jgi:hypothetical protein